MKLKSQSLFLTLFQYLLLCSSLITGVVFGQCSEYMNRASINEISTVHNWKPKYGDFIEVKLLDSSIPTSVTDEWSLMICSDTCNWTHLSNFTRSGSFFVKGDDFVWGFISWRTSFDVMLRDKWGYTIDYLSVNGHSAQSPACTTTYDSTASSGPSTRGTRRMPDGSGSWDTPSGNSEPPSEGEANIPAPANAAILSIDDATANQGSSMVFNISVPNNSYEVTIQYSTFNGTAVAGTDYTATTGTIIIPIGTYSATVSVPILTSGATEDKSFYLLLDSVVNADAPDQVAIGTINSAAAAIDHYRFEYDGSGLTCTTEAITVKACANADCSTLYASETTGTFGVSTLEPSSSSKSLIFTGSTTEHVAQSSPTTVTMSLSATSPTGSLKCYENGILDNSCDYITTDTGFIFYNETAGNQTIPTQIAGKPSDVGSGASTIVLQAVQTNTTTGACSALFADNTVTSVELSYRCVNPTSCSSAVSIGNTNEIPNPDVNNSYNIAKYASYSTHSLYFKSNSKATINLTYPDVGQIQLYAKKTVNLGGDLPQGESKTLMGNSNEFVVRPFGFYINISGNPGATDNTGGVFKKAGESFDMNVSAVQWAAGDDTNGNGVPQNNAVLSDNAITANFGQENQPEVVTVSSSLLSPAGGAAGSLQNNQFTNFVAGTSSHTIVGGNPVSWSEVGIISLTAATDASYIGSGSFASTTLSPVGRFVPDHFRLTSSSVGQSCSNAFNYFDQEFSLMVNVAAEGVGNNTLQNYDSDTGTDYHGLSTFSLVAENMDSGVDLGSRFAVTFDSWTNGVSNNSYTTKLARLTSIDGPYDNLYLGLKINDGDNFATIKLIDNADAGTNMNASTVGACTIGGSCDGMKLNASEVKFRYGRINSDQIFGPATQALTLPLVAEYFDGNSFVTNALDSCSVLPASKITIAGTTVSPFAASYVLRSLQDNGIVGSTTVDTSPDNTTSTNLTAIAGEFNLKFNVPSFSAENIGYVPVSVDLTDFSWLQFDWDTFGTGAVDPLLPSQNVTFGQFRGNDRVIYWREKK